MCAPYILKVGSQANHLARSKRLLWQIPANRQWLEDQAIRGPLHGLEAHIGPELTLETFMKGSMYLRQPKSRKMAILTHLKLGQRDAATLLRLATPAVSPRPKVAKAVKRSR